MAKVSIVMPSLNVREYIEECIESVIAQTIDDIQIICVDAGSTDGTLEVIQQYARVDNRIKVIISDKKSYGYQMNLGFAAATGEYIGIVETDDYIPANMYQRLYEVATENDVDIVKANFSRFVGDGDERKFAKAKIASKASFYDRIINPQNEPRVLLEAFYTWAGIYRREFIEKFDIRHNETPGASYQDNGFYFQTFACAESIYLISDDLYRLRRDNPNSSINNSAKVFCICDEYDFIFEFLCKDEERYHRFLEAYWLNKHRAYFSTLKRVAQEHKLAFLERYYYDFRSALMKGETDFSYFNKTDLGRYRKVMNDREGYFFAELFDEKLLVEPQDGEDRAGYYYQMWQASEMRARRFRSRWKGLERSKEYRIGKKILFIPKIFIGGVRCLIENGFRYTLKRIGKKLMGAR